jgi:isopenicillin N synthase-like dioxygenase
MATTTETKETYVLEIDSAAGPVYRTVKTAPPHDARPDEITVIDVSGIFSDDLSQRQAVASQVREACMRIGFFYMINHGIPDSVTDAAAEACLDFFHQSVEAKNMIYFDHEIEGYTGLNNEQINSTESVDVREKFKLHYRPSLDPTSKLEGYPAGGSYQEFLWEKTAQVPSFERAMTECFTARLQLARRLLRTCALALELPEEYFDEKVVQPSAALVLNYYPPLTSHAAEANPEDKELVGLGSHTDFGVITILWQDDTGGLQILNPEGEWINAKPIPGSLVCNMGDFMSMITNGKFVSDVHKAKNESVGERISIPFFLGFGSKTKIETVETCVEEGGEEKRYEGVLAGEWIRQRQIDLKVAKLGKGGLPLQ